MKAFTSAVAAATLALAGSFALAQGTPGMGPGMGMGPGGGHGHGMSGHGERRERMRAAYEACKDKPDRRACMSEQVCAKASDPARCQARAQERAKIAQQRMDERQKAHEACSGKRGDELGKCLGEQFEKSGIGRHHGPRS